MTSDRERELASVTESVVEQLRRLEERRATVDRQSAELTGALEQASAEAQRLDADRIAFSSERQRFAEELVRMNTVNKVHDR